jgi:hypothetical protein
MSASSKLRRGRQIINAAKRWYSCRSLEQIVYSAADKARLSRHKAIYIKGAAAYIRLHHNRSRDPRWRLATAKLNTSSKRAV